MQIDLKLTIDQAHLLNEIVRADRDRYLGALPAHLRTELRLVPMHTVLLNQIGAKAIAAYEEEILRSLSLLARPISRKHLMMGYAPSTWIDDAFANLLERGLVVISDQQGSKGCFKITDAGKEALDAEPPIAIAAGEA